MIPIAVPLNLMNQLEMIIVWGTRLSALAPTAQKTPKNTIICQSCSMKKHRARPTEANTAPIGISFFMSILSDRYPMKNPMIDATRPKSAGATENTVRLQANSFSIAGKITIKDCRIVALSAIVMKERATTIQP